MAKPIKILLIAVVGAVILIGLYLLFFNRPPKIQQPVVVTPPQGRVLTQAEQEELSRQLANSQYSSSSSSPSPSGEPQTLSAEEKSQITKAMTPTGPSTLSASQRSKILKEGSAQ